MLTYTMASNILLTMFSIIILVKISSGRYIVPGRPPVDLKNTSHQHPELEFRDHALRVGNIIADLLRSEIKLMLNINSTIANGKHHRVHSGDKGKHHAHHHHIDEELEEHDHFTESELHESHKSETHSSEESHVEVFHLTEPSADERHVKSDNVPEHTHSPEPNKKNDDEDKILPRNTAGKPIQSHKVSEHAHSHEPKNKIDEKDMSIPENREDCACTSLKNGGAQPNTLMLEQKLYGAILFNGSFQPNIGPPIFVQRFILNPSNLSQTPASLHRAHGQSSNLVHTQPTLLKPSTTLSVEKGDSHSKGISEKNNHTSNPHSQSHDVVPEPTTSKESAHGETSYNPLAVLAETSNETIEGSKSQAQDIQGKQETSNADSDSLTNVPFEMESQVESPDIELVETTITEKPSEEVKEEVIQVQNADEE